MPFICFYGLSYFENCLESTPDLRGEVIAAFGYKDLKGASLKNNNGESFLKLYDDKMLNWLLNCVFAKYKFDIHQYK